MEQIKFTFLLITFSVYFPSWLQVIGYDIRFFYFVMSKIMKCLFNVCVVLYIWSEELREINEYHNVSV